MAKEQEIYKHLENDKRVKAELKRLRNIYKNIPKEQKDLVKKLIENAAFMGILLEDLQEDIKKNGYKEAYQNGANQHGFKRSISADLYQTTIKNYSAVIKQLNDLSGDMEQDDGFDDFINRKYKD